MDTDENQLKSVDYTSSSTYKIFKEYLAKLFNQNGFKSLTDGYDCNEYRYKAGYLRCFHDVHGARQFATIDVVGIPMSPSILICLGSVRGKKRSVKVHLNSDGDYQEMERKVMEDLIVKLIELSSPGLEDLPPELKLRILVKLSLRSLLDVSSLNSTWHQLCSDDMIWKRFFKRDFSNSPVSPSSNQTWQEHYKNEYIGRKQTRDRIDAALRLPHMMHSLPPPMLLLPIGFGTSPFHDNLLAIDRRRRRREEILFPFRRDAWNYADII